METSINHQVKRNDSYNNKKKKQRNSNKRRKTVNTQPKCKQKHALEAIVIDSIYKHSPINNRT